MTMIRIRHLRTAHLRSAWTGFAKGSGLDISSAPILHSARIGMDEVYKDRFKGFATASRRNTSSSSRRCDQPNMPWSATAGGMRPARCSAPVTHRDLRDPFGTRSMRRAAHGPARPTHRRLTWSPTLARRGVACERSALQVDDISPSGLSSRSLRTWRASSVPTVVSRQFSLLSALSGPRHDVILPRSSVGMAGQVEQPLGEHR